MSVCGRQKGNLKRSQSTLTESESSMHFWGICCESGKQYNQVVGQRFRVTMAVLDPTSFENDASERIVSLIVLRDGIEYLLCVLKHDEIHQVSLNLVFDKGENVRFYIKGHGNVYLSGYQLTGSEEDILNDENGYLCPLVEVKTKNKKKKVSTSRELLNDDIEINLDKSKKRSNPGKVSLAGSSKSPSWSTLLNQSQDDEDDESDEDFTLSDEEFESDELNTSDEMEDLEDEEELDENELDNDSDAEEIEQILLNSRGSQKRRKQAEMLPEKRSKKGSLNNSSNSVSEDVICIDDDEDDDGSEDESDSGNKDTSSVGMKSSFNSPSKSKKEANVEVASNEKKSKKKKKRDKKLNDISILGTSANSPKLNSTVDESTPYRSGSQPSQKLKSGIMVQDLTVGRGPLAIAGKTVHVFYVGRFSDKKIFDSRVPGAGKKPFSFKLGAGQVIKGWDLGLVGMRVGGKRKLRIPPQMGYGSQQHPDIPPDSTLYFVVELVSVS